MRNEMVVELGTYHSFPNTVYEHSEYAHSVHGNRPHYRFCHYVHACSAHLEAPYAYQEEDRCYQYLHDGIIVSLVLKMPFIPLI